MKIKKVAKQCMQAFRVSEDYDSDSDASDDDNKTYRKGKKQVSKLLAASSLFKVEDKLI